MVKTITIGEQIYEFKDRITGLEAVNKMSAKTKEAMMSTVRLAAHASTNPKLTAKGILMLDYADFLQIIGGFAKIYGIPNEWDFLEKK